MRLRDHITMCWHLVLRNRTRYKAVLAAIAFGTAGFIVVRTMGTSVERSLAGHLELLGECTVMRIHWDAYHDNFHPGRYHLSDVNRLKEIPNVMAVAPIVSLPHVPAYVGTEEWTPSVLGVDHSYWKTQTARLSAGRLIGPSDVVGRKKVCVLGKDVVDNLFAGTSPVGKEIRVGQTVFEVIGILGGIQHTDVRRSVIVPITTGQDLFGGLSWIKEIYLRADDWNKVVEVREMSLDLLKSVHKGYEEGIRIEYYPKRISTVVTTVYVVKLFVYAAIVVTFLLGKVGLTSVMLSAVQARTREIGLRKALGAREEIIMAQFLTESVFISIIAGLFGVVIGLLLVQMLKGILVVDVSGYTLSTSILLDLSLTVAIGVIAGLYPSLKASRLDAVTAMRFE